MKTLHTEFAFNSREWCKLVFFMAAMTCAASFLAGVIGGHPWRDIIVFAISLPAGLSLSLWLLTCRWTRRSYVITQDGVVLRNRSRDVEHLSWSDIADVRPWPLAIITRSKRKIPLHLLRAEMERARDALLDLFNRNQP